MPKFKTIWSNYPTSDPCDAKNERGEVLFPNQCAIRVSAALKKSGVSFATFPRARKCWVHPAADHILAAKELADWLERGHVAGIGRAEDVTGQTWRDQVLDRTGVICFEDYYAPGPGGGGDHIDLWDGDEMTSFGSWFRVRFSIVVRGFWSDFRASRRIRFFPVS